MPFRGPLESTAFPLEESELNSTLCPPRSHQIICTVSDAFDPDEALPEREEIVEAPIPPRAGVLVSTPANLFVTHRVFPRDHFAEQFGKGGKKLALMVSANELEGFRAPVVSAFNAAMEASAAVVPHTVRTELYDLKKRFFLRLKRVYSSPDNYTTVSATVLAAATQLDALDSIEFSSASLYARMTVEASSYTAWVALSRTLARAEESVDERQGYARDEFAYKEFHMSVSALLNALEASFAPRRDAEEGGFRERLRPFEYAARKLCLGFLQIDFAPFEQDKHTAETARVMARSLMPYFDPHPEVRESAYQRYKYALTHMFAHRATAFYKPVDEIYHDLFDSVTKAWVAYDLLGCDAPPDSGRKQAGAQAGPQVPPTAEQPQASQALQGQAVALASSAAQAGTAAAQAEAHAGIARALSPKAARVPRARAPAPPPPRRTRAQLKQGAVAAEELEPIENETNKAEELEPIENDDAPVQRAAVEPTQVVNYDDDEDM